MKVIALVVGLAATVLAVTACEPDKPCTQYMYMSQKVGNVWMMTPVCVEHGAGQ